MVNLYEKPMYYSEFADKPIDINSILANEGKIITICAYKAQLYINKHYSAGGLSNDELKDMIQEVSICIMRAIDKYEKHTDVDFWAYMTENIKHEASKAYKSSKKQLGESPYLVEEAKKTLDAIEENNWGIQEAADKLHKRRSTIERHLLIARQVMSLDAENDEGFNLHSRLSDDEDTKSPPEEEVDIEQFIKKYFPDLEMSEEETFIMVSYLKNEDIDKKTCKRKTMEECRARGIAQASVNRMIAKFENIVKHWNNRI